MVINTDPSRRELAVFAVVLPLTFLLLGVLVGELADSPTARKVVWGVGAVVSLVYVAAPPLRRAIFVGASRATYPIGWLVSHLVLLAVFSLVVTPIAMLLRLLRKDPMERRFDPSAESYWTPRPQPQDVERYFQQF